MPIIEDRIEEQITREYPRRDYDSGDYLIRDRDRRGVLGAGDHVRAGENRTTIPAAARRRR